MKRDIREQKRKKWNEKKKERQMERGNDMRAICGLVAAGSFVSTDRQHWSCNDALPYLPSLSESLLKIAVPRQLKRVALFLKVGCLHVTPGSLIHGYQLFGGAWCSYAQTVYGTPHEECDTWVLYLSLWLKSALLAYARVSTITSLWEL
jgi:hypothetical protein